MKYIILAAGVGKRLHPLTNECPKALFQLDQDTTVIERCVRMINNSDKSANVIVVTGFYKEKIISKLSKYNNITFVDNPFYSVTNSVASLWFARSFIVGDVVILNADIVFDNNICEEIITKSMSGGYVLLDSSIKSDGDYNVQVHDSSVTVMSKELKSYFGEYAGITKFDSASSILLKNAVEYFVDNGYYDQWYENVLVQMIFNENYDLKYIDIKDYQWTEVDNVDDLIQAKRIHSL